MLFRTGNRITPPTARVKQSEWLRLKLPLQTGPVSSKIHQTVYKMQIRLLPHCNRTSCAIEFHPDRGQRLKHNLADNTIDKNSNLNFNLLSDSIDSNSLNEGASKTCMSPANPPSILDNPCLRRLGDTAIGNRFCCLRASQCRAYLGRHDAGSTGCQDPRLRTQRSRKIPLRVSKKILAATSCC